MIDARLGPVQARLLAPLARLLHARGARADLLSVTGFGIGVLAAICLCLGLWTPALGLILLNRLFDGLDGAVARLAGATERGAFLDIALDFLFYALIPLGFAVQDPALNALPAAVLLASFIGTGSSFLAFAAIAARNDMQAPAFPAKGIYYLGGLTEGFETIAIFVAMCLWPSAFPTLALVFAAACAITTLLRWAQGWRVFAEDRK